MKKKIFKFLTLPQKYWRLKRYLRFLFVRFKPIVFYNSKIMIEVTHNKINISACNHTSKTKIKIQKVKSISTIKNHSKFSSLPSLPPKAYYSKKSKKLSLLNRKKNKKLKFARTRKRVTYCFIDFISSNHEHKMLKYFIDSKAADGKPLYSFIKKFYAPMDYILFAKLILDLQKALNDHNFNIIEKMFSDNMWECDQNFMKLVHDYTEFRKN
jgi:hypothetical protein